ncbi:hypothetical protein SAMN05421798_1372, partial [Pseudovibrio axinellae]
MSYFSDAYDSIRDFAGSISDSLSDFAGSVSDSLSNFTSRASDGLNSLASGITEGISSFVGGVVESIGDVFSGAAESVGNFLSTANESFNSFVSDTVAGVGNLVSGFADGIGSAFQGAASFVNDAFLAPVGSAISGLMQGPEAALKADIEAALKADITAVPKAELAVRVFFSRLSYFDAAALQEKYPELFEKYEIKDFSSLVDYPAHQAALLITEKATGKLTIAPRGTDDWTSMDAYDNLIGLGLGVGTQAARAIADYAQKHYEATGQKIDIAGHSMGGGIAEEVGRLAPDAVGEITNVQGPSLTESIGPIPTLIGLKTLANYMSGASIPEVTRVTSLGTVDNPTTLAQGILDSTGNIFMRPNDYAIPVGTHNSLDAANYFKDELDALGLHVMPIILDLNGNGLEVTGLGKSDIFIDADGSGLLHRTAWAAAGDGVLFFDPDGRNAITEQRQFVFTEWDPTATSDMEALASVFDSNGDGVLSAADEDFDKFKVLVTNADGSQTVKTLTELGITELGLRADASNIELSDGSIITGKATFTWADGSTGTLGDVMLVSEGQGYRVEQVETVDAAGTRHVSITTFAENGAVAYRIFTETSHDGLSKNLSYDDNGDGVIDRIQTIERVFKADGNRVETETHWQGADAASAVLTARTVITRSVDGTLEIIERDATGGGWFSVREVRTTADDGSQTFVVSQLAMDGSVISSGSETVTADGSVRADGVDVDGDGAADTVETHRITTKANGSRTETMTTTNQDGSQRSHISENVSADGRSKEILRDLDGDGDIDVRESLIIQVASTGASTSTIQVLNGDGSLRNMSTTTQSEDALSNTTLTDLDGDGDIDLTTEDITTVNADGSREQIVSELNGDGSVRSTSKQTLGADKVSQETWVDLNQNGSFEASELVSSVVSDTSTQDRIASVWTRNADGSINAKTLSTTSADGLHTVMETDSDGDGDTDVSVTDSTAIDAQGAATRTITTRNQDGSLRAVTTVVTSADGLTTTTTMDVDGDGQIEEKTVETLGLEADGGTTLSSSTYAGDGTSRLAQTVVEETADRRTQTISADFDGDGSANSVSLQKQASDGSITLTETTYANDGTVLSQSVANTSANGLVSSTQSDLDGDGAMDVSVRSTTTLHADGSQTTVQQTRNADNTLRSASSVTVSDDGLETVTRTDQNGDGTEERVVEDLTVLEQDGSTTRTVETQAADGDLLGRSQTQVSDDQLTTTIKTDADGDGAYDLIESTTSVLHSDGSILTTSELRDAFGELRNRSMQSVSDNGRSVVSEKDSNGDGKTDTVTTQTIADNGTTESVTQKQDADGILQSQSRTVSSANGLDGTTQSDRDGDGTFESISETQQALNANGSTTSTTTMSGEDGTLWNRTVSTISDDGLSSTRQEDNNGDGVTDRTQTTTTVIAPDGSRTTTVNVSAADGSLQSKTVETVSGNGNERTRTVDTDGNGVNDEVITTVISDDGVTTTTRSTYSETGALLSKTTGTSSGNGLETTLAFDLDGNGTTDRSLEDVTVLAADGSRMRSFTHQSGQGDVLARENYETSGDGQTVTTRTDRDGDGSYESQTTRVTTFANSGEVSKVSTTKDEHGNTVASSTQTTSGNGLEITQTTDFDGDGTTNRTTEREHGAAGGSTQTVKLFAEGGDLLREVVSVTSEDNRTQTITLDLDGDGAIDQKTLTQIDLSDNQTTTHSQLLADGSTASTVTQTLSANGAEQSYTFDLDGDGSAEITRSTTVSYDASGSEVRVFEENYGENLHYASETVTSANGLTKTTSIDSNGDGKTDITVEYETILHEDGSSTFSSSDRLEDGTLRSSFTGTVSSDGRTVTKTYDFDGDAKKDKTEVTKVLADGSSTVTETAYDENGTVLKTAITTTSSDGLTTTTLRDGVTQTFTHSVLKDGSYTWDNGVIASATDTNIKVSHEIDAMGMETWSMEETKGGTTSVTTRRLDNQAKARLLEEAAQLYDTVLDRDLDPSEIEVLVRYVEEGQLKLTELANVLLDTAEYQTRYGTLTDV